MLCGNVCIVLQLTPHVCPAQPVHVKCFLRTVYGLNAYEGTKTTNSLHLSERYSAEFKQTIEINEQPTWYSFRNIWIFRCMQSHAEHSAVKWESFFSLIMQTEHFNNEPSLWDPLLLQLVRVHASKHATHVLNPGLCDSKIALSNITIRN